MNPMQSELRRARIAHAATAEDRRHRDTGRRSAQARSRASWRILARGAVGVPGQCLVGQTNPAATPLCWGGGGGARTVGGSGVRPLKLAAWGSSEENSKTLTMGKPFRIRR
jgi:hypothetical protein